MASHKILHHTNRSHPVCGGFTLIEILIVMGLLTALGGLSLILGMESYRGYLFRTERDTLVVLLQRARAQSVNNTCLGATCVNGSAHGVLITPDAFILFQGTSSPSRNQALDLYIPLDAKVEFSGLTEIVFQPLTGSTETYGDIMINGGYGRMSTTSINSEGQITWTN